MVALRSSTLGAFPRYRKDKPRKVRLASGQLGLPELKRNIQSHTTGDLTRVERRMYFPRSTDSVMYGVMEESSLNPNPTKHPFIIYSWFLSIVRYRKKVLGWGTSLKKVTLRAAFRHPHNYFHTYAILKIISSEFLQAPPTWKKWTSPSLLFFSVVLKSYFQKIFLHKWY